jgi:hypothetical protein
VPATQLLPCCSNPSAKRPVDYHAWFSDATSLIGRQKSGNARIAYSGVKRRNRKIQKYCITPAAEIILAVRRLPTTSACTGPIENPHPRAGQRRSAFDHRLVDARADAA